MIQILKWLAIVPFVLLALVCYVIPGYSFSGLVCLCFSGLILCYNLISLISAEHIMATKILNTVLTSLLCFGILIVGLTEVQIIRSAKGDENTQCNYVLVLGAGLRGTRPSEILQSRIDRAYLYLMENPDAVCILSGGQGEDEPISEAQCMYDHLVLAGIDPARLWMEDKSTSTWENFQFSMDLIEEKAGFRPPQIAVISSDFHLYRAEMFAKACGIGFLGVPAKTPHLSLQLNYYLREAAGVWHYLILGG